MSNQEILHQATMFFKQNYSTLTAESIICFLVFVDLEEGASVAEVAAAVGMAEPTCYQYMSQLTTGVGAGLITFQKAGDSSSQVYLTDAGRFARDTINATIQ